MTTLTWLHLSDLHFEVGDEHNRKTVLDALWEDIKECINGDGLQPDLVVFTGDVAKYGRGDEYKLARDHFFSHLLDSVNLSPKELFIVPGNHDVDWASVAMFSPDILARLSNRDAVNSFLASDRERRLIFESLRDYSLFTHSIFSSYWITEDPAYYYVRVLQKENTTIALLGLNSAWLSGFAKRGQKVDDYGYLLLGERQVAEAIEKTQDTTIRIALMHHPFEWLQEFDRQDAESRLRQTCHFILHGHRHQAGFVQGASLEGNSIVIPAGSVYDRREYPNGYSFVQLDLRKGMGVIYFRRYSDRQRRWAKDTEATGETRDGRWEFTLPKEPTITSVASAALPQAGVLRPGTGFVREYERTLRGLCDVFSYCEWHSRAARVEGRRLRDDEIASVADSWERSRQPHLQVQALALRIGPEARWRHWKELAKGLQDAGDRLESAIVEDRRPEISRCISVFSTLLEQLQTEVSVELDYLLARDEARNQQEMR